MGRRRTGDPFFSNVVLGIDYDGFNGQNTFTDWSHYAHTVAAFQTTVDTANPLFGTGAGLFNGNHNLQINDAPELRLDTGGFTIETAVKLISVAQNGIVIFKCFTTGFFPWEIVVLAGGQIIAKGYDNTNTLAYSLVGPTLSTGTYYRPALTRDPANNLVVLWVDGTAVASAALPAATVLYSDTGAIYLGETSTFQAPITAYQDETRLTNVCRFPGTTSYTLAAGAFPHH